MSLEREQIYAAWAPDGAPWSPWVKPVVFAVMERGRSTQVEPIDVSWAPAPIIETIGEDDGYRAAPERVHTPAKRRAALVIDLPATESVRTGISLVARGYRPIPVFNAAAGAPPGDVAHLVAGAIAAGTRTLESAALPLDAPPAFLLDSWRGTGIPTPGTYDGRWIVFPQDFPSARLLRAHGIERAIRRAAQTALDDDLAHVLHGWKDGGVEILGSTPGDASERALDVRPPPGYRSLVRRALAVLGLRRSAAGGFGGIVPVPSEGGSGYS
ncbi:hypothetical protein [Sandaracinus amylolyticus]|uniref:Uncharacterized protein n=1 Tax=Sandaracinus amylolyticus TaxID=927083 RepID=A0A0F6SI45_9BACT|nr:hypothetical protein [Sandaracinus amylolyticus]AKF11554.1 hypothetical protein DB32_008703 [Sandaracinus amylolyticus]